jgi:predicted nucleotidyltransferase
MLQDAKYLTANEKAALTALEKRIRAKFDIQQFILFGSKARGDFQPDSDIDLLVVTEKKLGWREKDLIISETYEINLMFGTLFTAHTVAGEEWENGLWTCLPIRQSIDKDGIPV